MSKKIDLSNKRILISRTDSIGDVMLTLPICHWLKQQFKGIEVVFLGRSYTKHIIESYTSIDAFYDWDELSDNPTVQKLELFRAIKADAIIHVFPNREVASIAKKVKIPIRIGTSHRSFHLLTCNYRVNFTRKRSDLHEAQLNFELLRPVGLEEIPTLDELNDFTLAFRPALIALPDTIKSFISNDEYVILHPKSKGSALEWPIEKYMELAKNIASNNIKVIFTGTDPEGASFRGYIPSHKNIYDSTGELTLPQLLTLIHGANALVACSTGPLHISGFLSVHTVGLFSSRRPIHPGRWGALGKNVHILVNDETCTQCKKGIECKCIEEIKVEDVEREILSHSHAHTI